MLDLAILHAILHALHRTPSAFLSDAELSALASLARITFDARLERTCRLAAAGDSAAMATCVAAQSANDAAVLAQRAATAANRAAAQVRAMIDAAHADRVAHTPMWRVVGRGVTGGSRAFGTHETAVALRDRLNREHGAGTHVARGPSGEVLS